MLLILALPGNAYLYQGRGARRWTKSSICPTNVREDPAFSWRRRATRRDGCRVPIPWTRRGPSLGFGPAPGWLPQPGAWAGGSVEAQDGVPDPMLELVRSALRVRRSEPALGDRTLRWLKSPRDDAPVRARPGHRLCREPWTAPLELPSAYELLVASAPLADPRTLPPDTAACTGRARNAPDR